jgi:hypothetical protein
MKMYNNKEKAIIIFTMLGEVFSDNILKKLPEEIFTKVQNDIIPMVGNLPLPEDIDSFILEHVLKDNDIMDINIDQKEEKEEEIDILDLSDEEFLEKADIEDVLELLKKEKNLFQNLLINFFSKEKKLLIKELLLKEGVSIIDNFKKTSMLEKIEKTIKDEFIKKLKSKIIYSRNNHKEENVSN